MKKSGGKLLFCCKETLREKLNIKWRKWKKKEFNVMWRICWKWWWMIYGSHFVGQCSPNFGANFDSLEINFGGYQILLLEHSTKCEGVQKFISEKLSYISIYGPIIYRKLPTFNNRILNHTSCFIIPINSTLQYW